MLTVLSLLQFVSFINKRLHPFLQLLPSNCSWHVHILALRRPILFSANDEEMMVRHQQQVLATNACRHS